MEGKINRSYFEEISKKVNDSFIKNRLIILIIFVAVIINIPRIKGIIGSDAYEIIWMANALKEGLSQGSTWLINPLSIFGFYPFSFYPIGFPFLVAVLFHLNMNIESIVFIFSIIEIIIASIGMIKLSSVFFEKKIYKHLLLVCYIFAPIFIRFTYFTLTARGPIIALAPWFFYYFFRDSSHSTLTSFLKQMLILLIMTMIHRLWVSFLPLVIIFFISKILVKYVKISELVNKNKISYYIALTIITIGLMILGYFFFDVDPSKITSPWFSNDNVFGLIINLIIDYGLRIGLFSLLLPIGVYGVVANKNLRLMDRQVQVWFKLISSTLLLCFVWTYTLYATVAYLPLYSIYMTFGIKFVFESNFNKKFKILTYSILGFSLCYVLAYSFLFSISFIYILIFIIIIALPVSGYVIFSRLEKTKHIISNLLRKITQPNLIVTSLLVSTVFFSLVTVDGQINESTTNFPYNYISLEEKEVCNYLKEEGVEGYIYVSHFQVARKIGGYGFLPTLNGHHHGQQLYYGLVSKEYVYNNFAFDFYYFLTNPNVLAGYPTPELNLILELITLEVNISTEMERILNLNIQYAVILKDNESIYPYNIFSYKETYSEFITSLKTLENSFETEHLMVWKLY